MLVAGIQRLFNFSMTKQRNILPGFGLSLGYTIFYLSLLVLFPLSMLFIKVAGMGAADIWNVISDARVLASLKLTLWTSLAAALVNGFFGLILAWVLVRYNFAGKRWLDGLMDLPFALPTAVAGITLTTLYSVNGWLGKPLAAIGIPVAYTPLGIIVALTFVGLPFVVRTVQPVLEEMERDMEEASVSLGASRWQTIRHIILPPVLPSVMTGFTLAFARGLGEYGSVVFISGNMPFKTEIAPLLIMSKLEQFDYAGATVIGVAMLSASFLLLLAINLLQAWTRKRQGAR
jgi:sulfate transport system permease protein